MESEVSKLVKKTSKEIFSVDVFELFSKEHDCETKYTTTTAPSPPDPIDYSPKIKYNSLIQ